MNKKFPIRTPRLPETATDGPARFLRPHREAGHPAVVVALTAAHRSNNAWTVVDSGRACGPMPAEPPGKYTHSHESAVNERHSPPARRVAQ
jgi:hypothetical protein